MEDLIKVAEKAFATGKEFPSFKAGDTITVAYKIVEGNKERIQLYRGVVIKIVGHQDKRRFTVRKMSGTVGVERIFPLDSPNIESIEVNKIGKVRCRCSQGGLNQASPRAKATQVRLLPRAAGGLFLCPKAAGGAQMRRAKGPVRAAETPGDGPAHTDGTEKGARSVNDG